MTVLRIMLSITTHKQLNSIGEKKIGVRGRRTILTSPTSGYLELYEAWRKHNGKETSGYRDTMEFDWVERAWYIQTEEPSENTTNIHVAEYAEVLRRYVSAYGKNVKLPRDEGDEEANDIKRALMWKLGALVRYAEKKEKYYINIPREIFAQPKMVEEMKKKIPGGYQNFVIEYGVLLLLWKLAFNKSFEKKTQTLIKDIAYKKRVDYEKYAEKLKISKSTLKAMEEETLAVMLLFFQKEVYETFIEDLKKVRIRYLAKKYKNKPFPKGVKESLNSPEIFEIYASDNEEKVRFNQKETLPSAPTAASHKKRTNKK